MIKIDIDTRCWQIPKQECFLGVESDDKVRILQFELSKNEFCDGLNFTDCNCFINYKNDGNDTIPYAITDMEVQEDGTVTFTWEVSRGATIFKGNTFAVLCAKKVREDGTIMNEWNSRIGSFTVSKGLEPLSSIVEVPEIDIISQLLLVAQKTNANAQTNINQSSSLLEKAEGLGYLKEEYDVLEARMNQFTSLQEGSTTGDAELIDGRIGYDGKVYENIGGAIRKQVGELKGDLAHYRIDKLKFDDSNVNVLKEIKNDSSVSAWFSVDTKSGGTIVADIIKKENPVNCKKSDILNFVCKNIKPKKYQNMVENFTLLVQFCGTNGAVLQSETIYGDEQGYYEKTIEVNADYVAYLIVKLNMTATSEYLMTVGETVYFDIRDFIIYTGEYYINNKIAKLENLEIKVEENEKNISELIDDVDSLDKKMIKRIIGDSLVDPNLYIGKTLLEVFTTSKRFFLCNVPHYSIDDNSSYFLTLLFDGGKSEDNNFRIMGYDDNDKMVFIQTLVNPIKGSILNNCETIYLDAIGFDIITKGNYVIDVLQLEIGSKSILPLNYTESYQDTYDFNVEKEYNEDFKSFYSNDYINNFIDRVSNRMNGHTLTFGYITDIQGRGQQFMDLHYQNLANVCKRVPVKFMADTGDFIEGAKNGMTKSDMANILSRYGRYVNTTCPGIPYIITKGNHDDNGLLGANTGNYSDLITDKEWYSRVAKYIERHREVIYDKENPTGCYYYVDDENSKTRTIFVNCVDIPYIKNDDGTFKYTAFYKWGIRQKQLEFIKKALMFEDKDNPTEWATLFMWHFPNVYVVNNIECILNMIKSKRGIYTGDRHFESSDIDFETSLTWNFDNCRGEVIGIIVGHDHIDEYIVNNSSESIIIASDCSMYQSEITKEGREYNSATEDSFHIVNVNRDLGKIYMTRFGAGNDRIINYIATKKSVGETVTVVSELDNIVSWESQDEDIAMVNNGTITYIKANSSTIITAKSSDGTTESWLIKCN